jgi:ElaA protein
LKWEVKSWKELSIEEMEDVFTLRSEVFVVEQDCVYQDIDGKDRQAKHVLGKEGKELVAYSRIFEPGGYFKEASFGRAVVKKNKRGKGLGDELVKETLKIMRSVWPKTKAKISAQTHLLAFYNKHGFKSSGEKYLEDGIPHIKMFCKL